MHYPVGVLIFPEGVRFYHIFVRCFSNGLSFPCPFSLSPTAGMGRVPPDGSPDLPATLRVCVVQHFSKLFVFIYFYLCFVYFSISGFILLLCSGKGEGPSAAFFPITLVLATRGWNPLGVVQKGAGWDHAHGFDSSVFDCLRVCSTTPSPSASLQPGTTRGRIMVYSHLQKTFCLQPTVLDPKTAK